jgi:hypothetical protein
MGRLVPLAVVAAGLFLPAAALAADGEGALQDSVDSYLAARADPVPAWFDPAVRPAVAPTPGDGGWDFRAFSWLMAPTSNIEAEVGGASGHIDADFGDTVTSGIRVEAVGAKFGILVELEAAGTTAEEGATDYDMNESRADLGLILRLVGGDDGGDLRLDVFGGARYRATEQDVGPDTDDQWWEPFVGTEVRLPFLFGTLVGRLTGSGFTVGPTTLYWSVSGAIEFSLGPLVAQIGLRYDDMHYDSSTGGGYGIDLQSAGIFVGIGVDF